MSETKTCRVCGDLLPSYKMVICLAVECHKADSQAQYRRIYKPRPRSKSWFNLDDADDLLKQRFWSKVDVRGPDDCWPWTGATKGSNGYGAFTVARFVNVTASRVAFALSAGPLGPREIACHTCDNPPCCNPKHLFKGTQVDNIDDCISKGRGNRSHGVAHRDARLTPEIVRTIRSTPLGPGVKTELARQYGVSLTAIRRVLARKTWKDVA